MHIYIYIYTYNVCMCIYIYIYIYRERERDWALTHFELLSAAVNFEQICIWLASALVMGTKTCRIQKPDVQETQAQRSDKRSYWGQCVYPVFVYFLKWNGFLRYL